MKRIQDSFALIRLSGTVAFKDCRIILLQIASFLFLCGVAVCIGAILYFTGYLNTIDLTDTAQGDTAFINSLITPSLIVAFFAMYLIGMFTIYITEAYTSAITLSVIRNKTVKFRDVSQTVWRTIVPLSQFTLLSASVGIFLKSLEDHFSWVGSISGYIAQGSWNLATAFAVVNIVDGQAQTAIEATKKSAKQLISAFGENIIVRIGLGSAVGLIVLVWVLLVIVTLPIVLIIYSVNLVMVGSIAGFGLLGLFAILFLVTIMESILKVMLYEYTLRGNEIDSLEKSMFKNMITRKNAVNVFNHS